jgi:hypothetical protein
LSHFESGLRGTSTTANRGGGRFGLVTGTSAQQPAERQGPAVDIPNYAPMIALIVALSTY